MKKLIFFFLIGMIVGLAACGGSTNAEPESFSFDIEALDSFAFAPSDLTVSTGSNVTINLENTGGLEHNFILVSDRADPLTVTESDALGGVDSGKVAGGETESFTFLAPVPGAYKFVCAIPGHAAGGMVGNLTVNP